MTSLAKTTPRDAVLDDLLSSRHSCRAYEQRQVPREVIERLLECAQKSASWCNTQPWQVIVTSGDGTQRFRKALLQHIEETGMTACFDFAEPRGYSGIYQERRRAAGVALYDAVGVARGDRVDSARQTMENFRLFGAPHVAIVTTDAEQATYGAIDAGLYTGTFLLAAESLGLGAIAQAALAMKSPFIRAHFGIPADRKVVVGISFGYSDTKHPANAFRTERARVDDVVHWIDQ